MRRQPEARRRAGFGPHRFQYELQPELQAQEGYGSGARNSAMRAVGFQWRVRRAAARGRRRPLAAGTLLQASHPTRSAERSAGRSADLGQLVGGGRRTRPRRLPGHCRDTHPPAGPRLPPALPGRRPLGALDRHRHGPDSHRRRRRPPRRAQRVGLGAHQLGGRQPRVSSINQAGHGSSALVFGSCLRLCSAEFGSERVKSPACGRRLAAPFSAGHFSGSASECQQRGEHDCATVRHTAVARS